MASLRPPALNLPDQAAVRWSSLTKIIVQPEENWPVQIYERPIIAGKVGERTIALIADPEAAKTVLGGPEALFQKWRIYERVAGGGTGRHSLSATAGAPWRRQRRAFSPMFRPENAAPLVPLIRHAADRAIASWNAKGDAIRLDISLEMTRLTLGLMWQALFAADPETDPVVARAAAAIYGARLSGALDVPPAKLIDLADAAKRRRSVKGALCANPFDSWGAASEAGSRNHGLTEQELYDNARNFLSAGYETTALTLTWALWLTAQQAEVQDRIHAEIDCVVGADAIAASHLGRLVFTGQVLRETMRLFPPSLLTVRQCREAVTLAGERLPAGTVLAVCIYALHRHRNWWRDPDLFEPGRFAPGSGEPRHRHAYLPFSTGRHGCIGAALGWAEAVTIFASILRHFRVSTDAGVPVRPRMTITLRPDREVPIVLHRRN